MNIHTKDPIYRDPFADSDRKGNGNGKGDAPRNVGPDFKKNLSEVKDFGTRDFTGFTEVRPGVWRKVYPA